MENGRKILIKNMLILPLLIMLLFILLITYGSSWLTTSAVHDISCLDDGWSISYGDKTLTHVNILNYQIGTTKKGEVITLKNTVFAKSPESTLMFKSFLTSVDVYMDGRLLHSYGDDYLKEDGFVPKKYNIVTLGKPGEHDIIIQFSVGENNFLNKFPPVYFGPKHELISYFFIYQRTSFFVGAFLLIYSCLSFSLWVYLSLTNKGSSQLLIGAFFSLLMGYYVYAYNDITCVIGNHALLFSVLEYLAFYLMPLALTILLYSLHSNVATRRQKIFITLNIVYPIIFLDMHISDYMHIHKFLPFVGILAVIEMLCLIPALVKGIFQKQRERMAEDYDTGVDSEIYLIIGCIILMLFSLLEIFKIYVIRENEVITRRSVLSSLNFMEVGMLFFMMCHFIYYFMNSIEHMSEKRIKSQLEGLAYKDALTGLMNRARCSQFYASLSGDYAIVSLDLDSLKYVNDTYGHLEGDRMLKAFAALLVKSFDGANIVGRTGGDEFIAVFENPTADVCDKSIRKLEAAMNQFNEEDKNLTLSASYGYAYSYEVKNKKYQDVFYLADQRMYKMKEEHHG